MVIIREISKTAAFIFRLEAASFETSLMDTIHGSKIEKLHTPIQDTEPTKTSSTFTISERFW
jgi:hypothetical protein